MRILISLKTSYGETSILSSFDSQSPEMYNIGDTIVIWDMVKSPEGDFNLHQQNYKIINRSLQINNPAEGPTEGLGYENLVITVVKM